MINYYLKLWSQTSLLLTVTDFLFVLFLRFSTHFLTRRHSKLKQPLGSSTLNRGFELILVFLFIINILIDNHFFCKNINCWLTDYCYTSISFFYYWWTPSKQISLNLLISAAKNLLQSRNFRLCSKPAVTKSFELKLKHVAARYSSPTIWPALLKKPTNVKVKISCDTIILLKVKVTLSNCSWVQSRRWRNYSSKIQISQNHNWEPNFSKCT